MTSIIQIRPMLAAKKLPCKTPLWTPKHEILLRQHLEQDGYLLMQPKIDGMRYMFDAGVCYSRSWTPWTNRYIQAFARDHADLIQGWDCEAVPGHTYNPNIFREAMSGLRSEDGSKEMTLYLFDNFDPSWAAHHYEARLGACRLDLGYPAEEQRFDNKDYDIKVVICPTYMVQSVEEIYQKEQELLAQGWEGGILRRRYGPYKYGRSTAREGYLVAVKRFKDGEAIICGWEPRYSNQNELQTSALGYAKRTAHQEGLVEQDTLGAMWVHLPSDPNARFKIGVFNGMDEALRKRVWDMREQLTGQAVKFYDQEYTGGYDLPRTPIWNGFRHPLDMPLPEFQDVEPE